MTIDWRDILIDGLAVFRLSVLLSEDAGPYRMFAHLRSWLRKEAKHSTPLRKSAVHEGVECLRCVSIWYAIPIAAYAILGYSWPQWLRLVSDIFLLAMALSGMGILWNRAWPKR